MKNLGKSDEIKYLGKKEICVNSINNNRII